MTVKLPVVSNSETEAFLRCPRLRFYRFVLRRRPLTAVDVLLLGTLIHVGLESWFGVLMRGDPDVHPVDAALGAIERVAEKKQADALIRVQAEELVRGYHCRWIDERLDVVAVELEFLTQVSDPILGEPIAEVSGKIDAIVRVNDSEMVIEHKSTSSDLEPGSMFWQRTRMSSQLGIYYVGATSIGHVPAGAVYDVIAKPKDAEPLRHTPPEKRRYRKDGALYKGQSLVDEEPEAYRERLSAMIFASPDSFYARQVVIRLKREVDEAVSDLAGTVSMMRHCEETGNHPRNPNACFEYNRACEYHGVCLGLEDVRDDSKFRTARENNIGRGAQ